MSETRGERKKPLSELLVSQIEWNPKIEPIRDEVWTKIDPLDYGTPDDWVPRHPDLIRLTGRHPLNAEPPSKLLVEKGLISPASLHYVRNHGRVPKLQWNTHKVKVEGLVSSPREFTMDELEKMPSITIIATVTCDGNRRKELNMIKKGRAFHWGAGATACSIWKGVPLRLLLEKCNIKSPEEGARFVCFEGSDQENLNHGIYGTSIPIAVAMETYNDIILAYEMNGNRLSPDHGFPVRLIVPGYIGGRMVKWLSKITLSDKESDSWYHWHDNKLLPAKIDFPLAESGQWWTKPGYILYELNINSVITHPSHEEWICDPNIQDKYNIRGYAYSGGGRRISRVEVSLDGGKNWLPARLHFVENSVRHGFKFWAWCHWSVEVPLWRIVSSKEIVCRAFDMSGNTQPEHHNWNVLGMFNNCWYRVKVTTESTTIASPSIGSHPGGWMVSPENEPQPAYSTDWHGMIAARSDRRFSLQEVAKHNTRDDCWIIIHGNVYDVTGYLKEHPGGADSILVHAGGDATVEFESIHSDDAQQMKEMVCIGILYETEKDLLGCVKRFGLRPTEWTEVTLISKENISHNTRRFRFKLPDDTLVGLPIGQHILLSANINGEWVTRPYTPTYPVMEDEDEGIVELVVKIYYPRGSIPGGKMSTFLDSMSIGERIRMKGPCGHVFYRGDGVFCIDGYTFAVDKISLIAGGTGITPIYQLIRAILKTDKEKKIKMSLLYANDTVEDILLWKELEEISQKHPEQFKVWYTVDRKPECDWKYSVGFIDEHMMKEHVFESGSRSVTFVCGPPAMEQEAAIPNLSRFGYTEWNIFEFG